MISLTIVKTLFISSLCAITFALCDVLAAYSVKFNSPLALVAAIVLGPISYLTFAYLNIRSDLAVVGSLVNALIVIFTTISGILFFGETNLQYSQIAGIILIVSGVILVVAI